MSVHSEIKPTKKDTTSGEESERGSSSLRRSVSSEDDFEKQESLLKPRDKKSGGEKTSGEKSSGEKTGGESSSGERGHEPISILPHRESPLFDLTLGDLERHAQSKADWHREVDGVERLRLRALLRWARASPGALGGCGAFKVRELWHTIGRDTTVEPKLARQLDAQGRAVQRLTVPLPSCTTMEHALLGGANVLFLEDGLGLPPSTLARIFEPDAVVNLMNAGLVTRFVEYVKTHKPNLQTLMGKEMDSFGRLVAQDKVDPEGIDPGVSGQVTNLHRFHGALLRRIEGDAKRSDGPIVLIVEAGSDHNGAYHRNIALEHLVLKLPTTFRLMLVEGTSLAVARSHIEKLPDGQVAQVIIAGHGQAQGVDMSAITGVHAPQDELSFTRNEGPTRAFVEKLLEKLSHKARITLSACLTNTHEFPPIPPMAGVEEAKRLLLDHIETHPSLCSVLQKAVEGKEVTVVGSNCSTTMAAKLWDEEKQQTDLLDTDQPHMTGTKEDYAATGLEPDGVWRALLTVWAQDDSDHTRFKQVIARRLHEKPGVSAIYGRLLLWQFEQIQAQSLWTNPGALGAWRKLASAMTMLNWPLVHTPQQLAFAGFWQGTPGLEQHVQWASEEAKGRPDMKLLLANTVCNQISGGLDFFVATIGEVGLQLARRVADLHHQAVPIEAMLLRGAQPGVLVAAALAVLDARWDPGAVTQPCARFLASLMVENGFPKELGLAPLLGGHSEAELVQRVRICLGESAPELPKNLTSDGASEPDVAVQSVTKSGKSIGIADVTKVPNGDVAGQLRDGEDVDIIGETRTHYAIEWKDGVRFVAREWLVLS